MENKKTLDQIRVAVALREKNNAKKGSDEGKKVKNYPTMIQNNGLLGTLAYSAERKIDKRKGDVGPQNPAEHSMAKIVIKYLIELEKEYKTIGKQLSVSSFDDSDDIVEFVNFLTQCSPEQFRRINAEVLAFLNYFRRFAS
ncbi:MAG: type III-B CRISPR module-associated protein Cmr5 [Lentisphaerae bacterium]|nr:type III-B CRISPR module-associated protein Cmr5 [Lentisphaerota bacterium]